LVVFILLLQDEARVPVRCSYPRLAARLFDERACSQEAQREHWQFCRVPDLIKPFKGIWGASCLQKINMLSVALFCRSGVRSLRTAFPIARRARATFPCRARTGERQAIGRCCQYRGSKS